MGAAPDPSPTAAPPLRKSVAPAKAEKPPLRLDPPRRPAPPPHAAPIEPPPPVAPQSPAGPGIAGGILATVGTLILVALAWGLGWGLGGLLVFLDLADPATTINMIAQYGFTVEELDFAANAAVAGVFGGAAAGLLMIAPFAGVFAAGPVRFAIALAGWGLAMALSRYAAIAFNFYTAEQILAYFAVCGFILGAGVAATLVRRKPGGALVRILATGVIWGLAAAAARYLVIVAIGL